MKTTNKALSVGVAIVAITLVLFLALSAAAPALSATLSALATPTSTPAVPLGEVIPLKSMAGLTSLNATVKIDVNGLINGKRTQGDLNAVLMTNDKGESKISLTGGLLGDLAAQVGGSIVGLFKPSSVDIYKVSSGTYIVVNSLVPVCVKPSDPKAAAALDDMSPISMLNMLTTSDVARGKLAGQTTLNGTAVNHYVINGDAFLAAAQKSTDPKLKEFGDALWAAQDANLYVDAKGGYPLAFSGSYSGSYDPIKFEGDFDVQVELTGVNTNPSIVLPSACNRPITP